MRGRITPLRVAGGLLLALVLTFVILERISSGYYLLLPDVAHPVAPLVHVAGGNPARGTGQLYFVDVQEEKASEFDTIFRSWLHPHSTLLPKKDIVPPGATDRQIVKAELKQMAASKLIAAAVAERQLGYRTITYLGALVDFVSPQTHAFGKLKRGDVIDSVNGTSVLTLHALHSLLGRVQPGAVVALGIRRGSKHETVRVETVTQKIKNKLRAQVGIIVEQAGRIAHPLPKKVMIDTGDIGGPSAGLAFTLEVMRRLGQDVTHGYRVAATGTINLDGSVGAIGGIEQKTWGVRDAGAQVFLVPAGDNARIAKKFAGSNLKVIPVTSLAQALDALAALPKLPKE